MVPCSCSKAKSSTVQCKHGTAHCNIVHPHSIGHSTALVAWQNTAQLSTAQLSTAQHSTAQHSTAQHSTAQHSTAQHSTAQSRTAHDEPRKGLQGVMFQPCLHKTSITYNTYLNPAVLTKPARAPTATAPAGEKDRFAAEPIATPPARVAFWT